MLRKSVGRAPNPTTAYWLIENTAVGRPQVLTVCAGAEKEALPVFSFPDEAKIFLRLGGFEAEGWRVIESTAGELVSRLAKYHRTGVELVALDPLPEMMGNACNTTIALVTLSLTGFAKRHAVKGGKTPRAAGAVRSTNRAASFLGR